MWKVWRSLSSISTEFVRAGIKIYLLFSSRRKNELDLIEIKQQFRTLWTILGSRFTSSPQKEQDSTFKFEMLAKGAADERLLHAQRSTECDMAWTAACDKDNDCPESITPIMNVRNRQLAVEVYVEKHRTSSPGEHSENARHPP